MYLSRLLQDSKKTVASTKKIGVSAVKEARPSRIQKIKQGNYQDLINSSKEPKFSCQLTITQLMRNLREFSVYLCTADITTHAYDSEASNSAKFCSSTLKKRNANEKVLQKQERPVITKAGILDQFKNRAH